MHDNVSNLMNLSKTGIKILVIRLLRKIYHAALSSNCRAEFKFWFFGFLRKPRIFNHINIFGISVCRDYIFIDSTNPEAKMASPHIVVHKQVEEDLLKPSTALPGEKINEMNLASVKTETILLDIQKGDFSLQNNHLIDSHKNVLGGYRTTFEKLPIHYEFLSEATSLRGIVVYLSDPTPFNYYHWMCGTLPLLRIYQTHLSLDSIDHFYVGQFNLAGFHQESLARLGIQMNRVIQNACIADRILTAITTRFCQFNDPISREAYFFSRNLFADVIVQNHAGSRKRIYVKRGNVSRRRVLNEDQILNLLEKYGFEPVQMNGKTIAEQAEIFSGAEAIVAPHGAALTNLLFVQPQTVVIELLPYGYINNCYFVLASHAEASYFYLQGEPTLVANKNAHSLDIQVNSYKLNMLCCMGGL